MSMGILVGMIYMYGIFYRHILYSFMGHWGSISTESFLLYGARGCKQKASS